MRRLFGLALAVGFCLAPVLRAGEPGRTADSGLPAGGVKRYGDLQFRTGLPVRGVALSPTGKLVACHTDEEVFIWTVPDGKLVARRQGSLAGPGSFSPDGKKLVVFEFLESVRTEAGWCATWRPRVLEADTGRVAFPPQHAQGGVTTAAWADDGRLLVLGRGDGVVELFDGANGQRTGRLEMAPPPSSPVKQMAVSPDGKTAFVRYEQQMAFWDVQARKARLRRENRFDIDCLAMTITPDNQTLELAFQTVAAGRNAIESFDLAPETDLGTTFVPRARHTGVGVEQGGLFSTDGRHYAQAGRPANGSTAVLLDTEVHMWDLSAKSGKQVGPAKRGVPALAFSADGKVLVTGGLGGALCFWNTTTGEPTHPPADHTAAILALAVSPDERLLATGSDDNTLRVREIATGKVLRVLTGPMDGVTGLTFLPGGKTLVSRSRNVPNFRLWDWEQGRQVAEFSAVGGDGPLVSSRDGRYVGFSSGPFGAFLDVSAKALARPPHGAYAAEIRPGLRFSHGQAFDARQPRPDVPSLDRKVEGGSSGLMRWDCAAFSPDGSLLVTGLRNRLALANPADGQEVRRLTPVSEPAPQTYVPYFRHVLFTPDGKRVIAVRDVRPYTAGPSDHRQQGLPGPPNCDQEIQVWDTSSGARLAALRGHRGPIHDVALAENGRALFTAGADGTVLLWDLAAAPAPVPPPADVPGLAAHMFGADEFAALQAMQSLVADPQKAAQVIQTWWADVPRDEALAKLVAGLADRDLAKRLNAVQALAELRPANPAGETHLVRAALERDAGETKRLCARDLLGVYSDPATREQVNLLRVAKLSEWLADDAAKERLKLCSERLPSSRGGKAAREALKRISAGTHRQEYDALPPLPRSGDAAPQPPPLRILTSRPSSPEPKP